MKKFTKKDFLIFGGCIALAGFAMYYNGSIQSENAIYFPHPLTDQEISKYSNSNPNAIMIYPVFTQMAYKPGGFYDFYSGKCPTCTTVSMKPFEINGTYNSGGNAFDVLTQLHYPFVTDMMVDKHPEILDNYDEVILLHNEYMTQTEFNAISHHKNVIYLYPNSAYAQVSVNYKNLTMTLVKGHGYDDDSSGQNGFDYVTNSKHEYDLNCKNYKWEQMPNGMQISCWPEFLVKSDRSLLQTIKDFPEKMPPLIGTDTSNVNITGIPFCNQYGYCTQKPQN